MRFTMILCAFLAFASAACDQTPEFSEQKDDQAVTIYVMGNLPDASLMFIQNGFDGWNSGIQAKCHDTKQRFVYGGERPNAPLYDENSTSDGVHGIYLLKPDELTDYGQQVWNQHRENNVEAGTFMDDDDILVYWTLDDSWLPMWPDLQPIIAHELGHGGGLVHVDDNSSTDSIMKPQHHSFRVQPVDIDAYVDLHGC